MTPKKMLARVTTGLDPVVHADAQRGIIAWQKAGMTQLQDGFRFALPILRTTYFALATTIPSHIFRHIF
jgi:hypothetical protein